MNRWLFLPESSLADLELLSSLDESRVAALVATLDSDQDRDRYRISLRIAQALHIADQAAAEFYTFWEYVRREQRAIRKSPDEVLSEIVIFLRSHPDNKFAALSDAFASQRGVLQPIFGDFPKRELSQRLQRFEMGPLPHVHSVESICDIRPVFERGNETIGQFIPVVTMRISYHDSCSEHHELIVQLTDQSIRAFEEDLQRVRRRLEAVKAPIEALSSSEAINGKSRI